MLENIILSGTKLLYLYKNKVFPMKILKLLHLSK